MQLCPCFALSALVCCFYCHLLPFPRLMTVVDSLPCHLLKLYWFVLLFFRASLSLSAPSRPWSARFCWLPSLTLPVLSLNDVGLLPWCILLLLREMSIALLLPLALVIQVLLLTFLSPLCVGLEWILAWFLVSSLVQLLVFLIQPILTIPLIFLRF